MCSWRGGEGEKGEGRGEGEWRQGRQGNKKKRRNKRGNGERTTEKKVEEEGGEERGGRGRKEEEEEEEIREVYRDRPYTWLWPILVSQTVFSQIFQIPAYPTV